MADAAADLVWPRECPLSDDLPWREAGFRHLSAGVVRGLPIVNRTPWCTTCGHPFPGELSGPQTCVHCADLQPEFTDGRTVMLAHGTGRMLLHEFKYHGARHLVPDFARLAARAPGYLERLEGAVLVPVPLHRAKFEKRGYNQSELIARALARRAPGATVDTRLLRRVRDTPTQTHLDRDERRRNMRDAFAVVPAARPDTSRAHILVDDVFTTGATLNEAAAALRAAGITRLGIATLAHG